MTGNVVQRAATQRTHRVERRFRGSVLDVADARRFARRTADWWGVDAAPVECVVDELARRAMCRNDPGFVVALTLDAGAVHVDVTSTVRGDTALRPVCAPAMRRPLGAVERDGTTVAGSFPLW